MSNLTETADLRAELVEVTAERDALRAQLDGDLPAATRWLQRKVWRQAAALDALNRRVTGQRFVLRTLDELGRSLTATEYQAARDRIADPQAAGADQQPGRGLTLSATAEPNGDHGRAASRELQRLSGHDEVGGRRRRSPSKSAPGARRPGSRL